jgi:hypothetical protein
VATQDAASLEQEVGHPGEKWSALQQRIQDQNIQKFSIIQDAWLDLVWCLDRYRVEGVVPRDMGNPKVPEPSRLAAIYRGKGNWFSSALALLLENQTDQRLAPRAKVQGFSQSHQVDVAWPVREIDPLICLETKVTGAPAYGTTGARKAAADWTNRRKELKFAATDLKLARRQQETRIEHWDVWRRDAAPMTFFLWAARMTPTDKIDNMVREVQALVKSYLEGAGIIAWEVRPDGSGYQAIAIPVADQVSTLDNVLYRIASEIRRIAPAGQQPPPPELPARVAIDVSELADDTTDISS